MPENTVNKWFALAVSAAPETAEALEFAFNELDALGTEIDHLGRKADDFVTVTGFFSERLPDEGVGSSIAASLSVYGFGMDAVRGMQWSEIADTDWLYNWKKHWKPTVIGGFVVSPPWEEVSGTGRHVIRIEPNMAFGTGTHDTTQLCLRAIERYFQPGFSLLDVGTGTGILAIGAAMITAAKGNRENKIQGFDTDAASIDIARENAVLNGVGDMMSLEVGPISAETPAADMVAANLTLDVILPILDLLLEKASRVLLLSGILAEQEPEILAALEARGISDAIVERSGEWISVVVERP